MTITDTAYISLEKFPCPECGITMGLPTTWLAARRRDGKTFFCPNKHPMSYTETTADRLQKELDRAQARETHLRDQRDAAERRVSAQKGQVTKLKKRAQAGMCPCCNRSFVSLAEHMKTQHPEFDANADSVSDITLPRTDFGNVRQWGVANGWQVGVRGRLPVGLLEAFLDAREKAEALD